MGQYALLFASMSLLAAELESILLPEGTHRLQTLRA